MDRWLRIASVCLLAVIVVEGFAMWRAIDEADSHSSAGFAELYVELQKHGP